MSRVLPPMLLLLFAGVLRAAEPPPAVLPPIATFMIESAKYCLGSELPPGFVLTRKYRPIHPIVPKTITLKLSVRIEYQNQGPVPLILVPLYHVNEFSGRSANHLVGKAQSKPGQLSTLDFGPFNDQSQVLPMGGAYRLPFAEEVSVQVFSPGHPKENLLGRKLWLQLETVPYRLSPMAVRELAARKEGGGMPWTGTVRTNILDFDISPSPATVNCVRNFKID